jgi:hypothetical protein
MSNADFSIVLPVVTVTSPNGSGAVRIGDNRQVTFNHNLGIGQAFAIEISRDGGETWSPITTFTSTSAASGSYGWRVSGPATSQARIRVRWSADATVADLSDVNFTIAP